jgi:photosystem II stability/assembly factor-like uncharacterized protein
MKNFVLKESLMILFISALLINTLSCLNNTIPRINVEELEIEYYITDKESFLNDPVKQADFGSWELIRHINYYHVENIKGDITAAYLIYLVTLAGFHTENYGITVGPDDDARYTNNGGKTWTKAPNDLNCRHGLDIVDKNIAWHTGNGGIRVTTDGGRTWLTVWEGPFRQHLAFTDNINGWCASSYNLYKTSDGGKTFSELQLPGKDISIAAISLRTVSDGYLLDTNGILYTTADGGNTWIQNSLGLNQEEKLLKGINIMAAVRFIDLSRGRIVFAKSDGTLWTMSTVNGGLSWSREEIPGLKDRAVYFHVYLSRDYNLLTLTNDFYGLNESFVLRYKD